MSRPDITENNLQRPDNNKIKLSLECSNACPISVSTDGENIKII